ncbi:uncharacterized protein [Periplaneta americana]|uniref:uncharacterized protein n=1 Tax=Periplaneta americana TaxID=6978 RepID=UPI0037E7D93A
MNVHNKNPKFITVEGKLTALSHLYITTPRMSLMELMSEKLHHIISRDHSSLLNTLIIGNNYKVTRLVKKIVEYSNGRFVKILETSPKSSFKLLSDKDSLISEPSFGLVNYEGKVVKVCLPFRMFQLQDNTRICLDFLMTQADVLVPEVGQTVSVYNAHRLENDDNRYDIVLCGRSCIILHGMKKKEKHMTSIMKYIKCEYSYRDLLWVMAQLTQFEEKFDIEFLSVNGLLSKRSVQIMQQLLLVRTINIHYPSTQGNDSVRSVSREFLSSPHECMVTKPPTYLGNYLTLHQVWEQIRGRLNPLSSKSWRYSIMHCTSMLVGFLSTCSKSGYWTLSDSSCSIPCVLTSGANNVIGLHKSVVLVKSSTLVTEEFQNVSFVYIVFAAEDVEVIYSPSDKCCQRKGKESGATTLKAGSSLSDNATITVGSGLIVKENDLKSNKKESSRTLRIESISRCSLLTGEAVAATSTTYQIIVHHKTTVIEDNQYPFSMCCVLISLIGTMYEVADGNYFTQRHYVVLTGNLIHYCPLLSINCLYMLHLPAGTSIDIFCQSSRLKLKSCLLPDVRGVFLPQESTFSLIQSHGQKSDSYNVTDRILKDVAHMELVDVEGMICDRLHNDVKFNSEKVDHSSGFGVPDMKTIILKLKDVTSAFGEEVSLYLSNWKSRAYPYGLISGARIRALFVAKHNSRNSSYSYLQATDFTRIEVLNLPKTVIREVSIPEDWGKSCILTQEAGRVPSGKLLWGSLSKLKILKLTVVTSCLHCKNQFKNGCCVSCSSYPPAAVLSASATCCVEDILGKVLIFMKDVQVQELLGLSKPYWGLITKLVSQDGREINLPQRQWNPHDPIGKRVLQGLLKVADKEQNRFHILCRKMKKNISDGRYEDVPKLYCVALRRPRPGLLYPLHSK